MNSTQALFDGLRAEWQRQRAASQMTLGTLITRLESLSEHTIINISYPHSYRGYYDDIAFEPTDLGLAAKDALILCRSAMGEVFQGYKGGDFQMGRNTPVWIAQYGDCGQKLISINDDGTLELAEDS